MKSRWRSFSFGVVVIVSMIAGLLWHKWAAAPTDEVQPTYTPNLRVEVYSSEPDTVLNVMLDVAIWDLQDDYRVENGHAYLKIEPPAKGDVLVLVSSPKAITNSRFVELAEQPGTSSALYGLLVSSSNLKAAGNRAPAALNLGYFEIPRESFVLTKDLFSARLPVVGGDELVVNDRPQFGIGETGRHDILSIRQVNYFPSKLNSAKNKPNRWTVEAGEPAKEVFWKPGHLNVAETLDVDGFRYENAILKSFLPSDGHVDGSKAFWRGEDGMTPELVAVGRDLEERRSRDEFLSGVALATGAAALIALVQEGPDKLGVRRRRGKFAERSWSNFGRREVGVGWPEP
jgi:hypothetical protein